MGVSGVYHKLVIGTTDKVGHKRHYGAMGGIGMHPNCVLITLIQSPPPLPPENF